MIFINDIIASFQIYYGADWASMLFGFLGAFLIAKHKRLGFVFLIISMSFAIITAVIANQYGFIFANLINIAIAVYGFYNWKSKHVENI